MTEDQLNAEHNACWKWWGGASIAQLQAWTARAAIAHKREAELQGRIEALEKALTFCVESIHVIEQTMLPLWEAATRHGLEIDDDIKARMPLRFAEWSHPANSVRWAEATLNNTTPQGEEE